MAIATNIAPNDLLDAPPEIFWAMVATLQKQQQEAEKATRRR